LLVASDTTIAELHAILQVVMGWHNDHLHRFRIHGKEYGVSLLGGIGFSTNPHQVRLRDFRLRPGERFLYEYDFAAGWEHDLRLERVLPVDPKHSAPFCSGGQRACPPAHCLGVAEYQHWRDARDSWEALLELQEQGAIVAATLQRWLETEERPTREDEALMAALAYLRQRQETDPERFDRRQINAALCQLKEKACSSASR
jgi:hypothetical protein